MCVCVTVYVIVSCARFLGGRFVLAFFCLSVCDAACVYARYIVFASVDNLACEHVFVCRFVFTYQSIFNTVMFFFLVSLVVNRS